MIGQSVVPLAFARVIFFTPWALIWHVFLSVPYGILQGYLPYVGQ